LRSKDELPESAMEWIFIVVMGLFGCGIGRAIKLYLNRDLPEYSRNVKIPTLGLATTFSVGGLLHKFADMPAPADNWITWAILGGPFLLALLADERTLRLGQ